MILVIDTSEPAAAWLAQVGGAAGGRSDRILTNRDNMVVAARVRQLVEAAQPGAVAVATGPGSFTGLRVGVSLGLGLAMGLGIPIIPLPSLGLRAAQSRIPATAVLDAGRGRVYYQPPGGLPKLGEPAEIPAKHPLVGNVGPRTEASLIASGHAFVKPAELTAFHDAAASMLEMAREVPYGSLEIQYMQSFSIPTKSEPSA